jgi:hypothetical protein
VKTPLPREREWEKMMKKEKKKKFIPSNKKRDVINSSRGNKSP